jgi:hypothetical protein
MAFYEVRLIFIQVPILPGHRTGIMEIIVIGRLIKILNALSVAV